MDQRRVPGVLKLDYLGLTEADMEFGVLHRRTGVAAANERHEAA